MLACMVQRAFAQAGKWHQHLHVLIIPITEGTTRRVWSAAWGVSCDHTADTRKHSSPRHHLHRPHRNQTGQSCQTWNSPRSFHCRVADVVHASSCRLECTKCLSSCRQSARSVCRVADGVHAVSVELQNGEHAVSIELPRDSLTLDRCCAS